MTTEKDLPTLYWKNRTLYLIDQRYLPRRIEYRICRSCPDVVDSIMEMTVRGAPAIGISAAFGLVLEAASAKQENLSPKMIAERLKLAGAELLKARPTAVNLAWGVERILRLAEASFELTADDLLARLETEALAIYEEDIRNNRLIGRFGAKLVPDQANILTHCNAGALATGGYGTALGVVRTAFEEGKQIHVYVDETRPLLQGARLTAFELFHEGIAATLITDNAAGHLMALGKIDLIVVGADRIAANGDAANKIGTYSLAVLARYHQIPFYVAAPLSTIDRSLESGSGIVIEERCITEVTHLDQRCLTAAGFNAFNPAFDVTPAGLISAIITEKGIVRQPASDSIAALFRA